jgi:tetratricopeptide (TPR) repeat protein
MEELMSKLKNLSFLVADPSASRKNIRTLLNQLGIKSGQVYAVDSVDETKDIIKTKKPEVIFIDKSFLDGSGCDIISLHKEAVSESIRIVYLISSNNSNVFTNNSIEDGVDSVILKPFTMESLKNTVIETFQKKLNPTPYQKTIQEAQMLQNLGKKDEALGLFRKAKAIDYRSSLANSYEGAILMELGLLKESRIAFNEGLTKNPNSYHCLMGLFDLLVFEKDNFAAYDIGRKIAEAHSIPLKKLPELIRLSVLTKKYEDILDFYKYSDAINETMPSSAAYLSAALVVCGLHFFQKKEKEKAIASFKKAITSKSSPIIIKRVLVSLISEGMQSEMKWFWDRSSLEVKNSIEVQLADLNYLLQQSKKAQALSLADQMIKNNLKDPAVFYIAIELSIEMKRSLSTIQDLICMAKISFPDLSFEFSSYLQKIAA